jgi:hypothetical protein
MSAQRSQPAARDGRSANCIAGITFGSGRTRHAGAASLIGATATLICVLLLVELSKPSSWLASGLAISAASTGWLLRLAIPAVRIPPTRQASRGWTSSPSNSEPIPSVQPSDVKDALHDLHNPMHLAHSPLRGLPVLISAGSSAASLRALLVDVVSGLASCARPRDREAGLLLLDYYVKRVGSHEVVMERLHLSRPTFYRRLRRGFDLVAQSLDEVNGLVPDPWSEGAAIPDPRALVKSESLGGKLPEYNWGRSGALQLVKT